jgi:hypothetical protein
VAFFRAYVDESGGRGTSAKSDDYFVMSAVIVDDRREAKVRAQLAQLRQDVGLAPDGVLHFTRLSHARRVKAVQDIARSEISRITNTIVCKRSLTERELASGSPVYIAGRDPMYLWAMRLTLERICWHAQRNGGKQVKVTFSHVKGFKPAKLLAYRSALERTSDVRIDWDLFPRRDNFRMEGPGAIELLQLADTTASATYHAVQPDRYGNTHPQYLEELRLKLFHGHPTPITSYGLKVFPAECAEPGGALHWLQSF